MEYNHSELFIKSEEEEDDTRLTDNSVCTNIFLGSYKKYEDDEKKTQELFELLKSWNQLDLFEHFANEQIDLEVLSVIKPHHFERLLEPFNLRAHIMFEHNLQQWRQSIGLPLPKYSENASNFGPYRRRRNSLSRSFQHMNVPNPGSSPNISNSVKEITPPANDDVAVPEITGNRITLENILKTSIKGKMLVDLYKQNQKFEESQRTLLIHLIAEYYNDKGLHLELSTTYKIEDEIISRFPTEQLEYYRTSKRGRIYNKYCNYKYSLIKMARSSASKDNSSTVTAPNEVEPISNLVPEEDAEENLLILRTGNISEEQFEYHWKACTRFRINQIRKLNSLPLIFKKWPEYKLPHGYKYIAIDFKYLQPNWDSLVNNWDSVSEKLLNFLCTGHTIKSNEIKVVLSSIRENASKDCRDASLLWCLHGYLKPSVTICGINDKGKKSLSKISIKASQDSFVYVGKSLQDVDRHRQNLKEQYDRIYPFIAVLGTDIQNFSEIFVCVENVYFLLDNFINALDLCYNIIILFKLEYPTACKAIWSFIQNIFFETTKILFPRVHVLVNELKEK